MEKREINFIRDELLNDRTFMKALKDAILSNDNLDEIFNKRTYLHANECGGSWSEIYVNDVHEIFRKMHDEDNYNCEVLIKGYCVYTNAEYNTNELNFTVDFKDIHKVSAFDIDKIRYGHFVYDATRKNK